ncbi:hypothetical protein ACN6KF_003000 [Labrys sp. La1]|uniref:hypothetical protein n=1 Tax=Labrys sp. La1 TaxID=3404917 RepID=UPI003EBFE8AA
MVSSRQSIRDLLSEGLDLCVRARNMDAIDRRNNTLAISKDAEEWLSSGAFDRHVERHNAKNPDAPISTRSGTIALWVQEQYDTDLADWERRARRALMEGREE